MTDNILIDAQVSPQIHVVVGTGMDAITRDLTFADIALEGDDAGTISDSDLLHRVERWLDMVEGSLDGRKVNRPATGNVVIGAENEYG